MRVRCRDVDPGDAPEQLRPYLFQTLVTPGSAYAVCALSVFHGDPFVLLVDDSGTPGWRPTWLFDMEEGSLPQDWVARLSLSEPSLVLGPPFIARDQSSYEAMVSLDDASLSEFWRRYPVE